MDVHRTWCPGAIDLVSLSIVDHIPCVLYLRKMKHAFSWGRGFGNLSLERI
jgi:hypothetical protein